MSTASVAKPIVVLAAPAAQAQATAQATPAHDPTQPWDYTPPPLPQPLPPPGGPITQVIGPAPAPAPGGAATPAAAANPVIPVNPGAPPQPVGSPEATPAASPVALPTPAPSAVVTLTPDFTFDPPQVTIQTGQAVQWVNNGRAPQTVTADPARADDKNNGAIPDGAQPFDSGVLNAGAKFTHVFDVAGTYSYFSMPQESGGMLGTVLVQ